MMILFYIIQSRGHTYYDLTRLYHNILIICRLHLAPSKLILWKHCIKKPGMSTTKYQDVLIPVSRTEQNLKPLWWWTKLTPSLPCTDTGYLFPSPLDAGELSGVSLNEVTSKFKWILPPFSAKSFPYDLVTSAQSTIPVCGDQRPRVP
jgi:hypothetical protein